MKPIAMQRTSRGFTLVELLVVIAIIGVLVALLLPAVQFAREAARRMQCSNNLKQIGVGIHTHNDALRVVPPGAVGGANVTDVHTRFQIPAGVAHGWAVFLLPYIEQQPLSAQYRLDRDWRAPENRVVRETRIPIFNCPSTRNQQRMDKGTSGGFTWRAAVGDYAPNNKINTALFPLGLIDQLSNRAPRGMLEVNRISSLGSCHDGLSVTLFIAEDAGRPTRYRTRGKISGGTCSGAGWANRNAEYITHGFTLPGNAQPGPYAVNVTNDNEIFGFHPGGAMVLFGDGSVHLLGEMINMRVVGRLITCSANEPSAKYE